MDRPRTRSTGTLSSSSSSYPTCKGLSSIGSEGRVRKSKVRNKSSSKSKSKSKPKSNSPSTTTGPASSRTTTSSSATATSTTSSSSSSKKLSRGDIISQAILQGAQLALSISAEFRDKRAALYRSKARTITESLRRQGKRRAAMKYEADVDQLIAEFMADGERQLIGLAERYQQLAAGAYVTAMAQEEAAGGNATTGTMRGHWLDTVLRKMEG